MESEQGISQEILMDEIAEESRYVVKQDVCEDNLYFRRHGEDGNDVDDSFDVKFPKKAIAPLVILGAALIFGQYYFYIQDWMSMAVLLALTIVPVLMWAGPGPAIAEKVILKWLGKVRDHKRPKVDEIFVGFPINTKNKYYIEANPMDLRMDNFLQIILRIKEVVFLSIGISIITARVLGSFFFTNLMDYWDIVMGEPYWGVNEVVIDTAIYLGPFALMVLFLVIPMFWIAEDMQIYRIDNLQDTRRVGRYLRSGMLSKILGFVGIILAYDAAKGYSLEVLGASASAIDLYMMTFMEFGLILIACAGAPFIVTVIYLLKYHGLWVNNVRIEASEFLPCCTLEISYVGEEELELLTHQEKVAASASRVVRFMNTGAGKTTLAILLVIGLIGCAFMGFIFTGIWSDPIYFP